MTAVQQFTLSFTTSGQGFTSITQEVSQCVNKTKIVTGLCHVFLHHTSASLIICENADPLVQQDLQTFMQRLVPEGNLYEHCDEGADDMPAHIRTILTQSFIVVPVTNNRLALGIWQGLYLWEHRRTSHTREVTVTMVGS